MLQGPSENPFALKAGDARSGTLVTMWDGPRPPNGYRPKTLRGAIILGTGGGSNGGAGTWFEGVVTQGNPPDEVDERIQADIVALGYGRQPDGGTGAGERRGGAQSSTNEELVVVKFGSGAGDDLEPEPDLVQRVAHDRMIARWR